MKKGLFFAVLASGLIFSSSCKKEAGHTDTINVKMVDAPASYDSVNVEIVEVRLNSETQGWINIPCHAGIYNLVQLQNGIDTLLATVPQFPAGRANQLRLILGQNNYVVMGGTATPLALSSEDETGLKLNLNYDFQPNVAYEILIDFDAAQSIVVEGNGTLRLKPVLKTVHVQPI